MPIWSRHLLCSSFMTAKQFMVCALFGGFVASTSTLYSQEPSGLSTLKVRSEGAFARCFDQLHWKRISGSECDIPQMSVCGPTYGFHQTCWRQVPTLRECPTIPSQSQVSKALPTSLPSINLPLPPPPNPLEVTTPAKTRSAVMQASGTR